MNGSQPTRTCSAPEGASPVVGYVSATGGMGRVRHMPREGISPCPQQQRPVRTTLSPADGAAAATGRSSDDGNLTGRASRALDLATELTGDTKTDTVNRALQVYAYLEQVTARGGSVYVREAAEAELERLKVF